MEQGRRIGTKQEGGEETERINDTDTATLFYHNFRNKIPE